MPSHYFCTFVSTLPATRSHGGQRQFEKLRCVSGSRFRVCCAVARLCVRVEFALARFVRTHVTLHRRRRLASHVCRFCGYEGVCAFYFCYARPLHTFRIATLLVCLCTGIACAFVRRGPATVLLILSVSVSSLCQSTTCFSRLMCFARTRCRVYVLRFRMCARISLTFSFSFLLIDLFFRALCLSLFLFVLLSHNGSDQ